MNKSSKTKLLQSNNSYPYVFIKKNIKDSSAKNTQPEGGHFQNFNKAFYLLKKNNYQTISQRAKGRLSKTGFDHNLKALEIDISNMVGFIG